MVAFRIFQMNREIFQDYQQEDEKIYKYHCNRIFTKNELKTDEIPQNEEA